MAEHYDVLVVGAGPGGLAAARAAADQGARVGLIDAQAHAGGQVWRHDVGHRSPALARRHVAATLEHPEVDWIAQTRVVAAESASLLVESPTQAYWLTYGALVLATGARELLLPFPGWTLPGVTGVGGLQALAKQGWPLAGKRVVVAGSGPLLLAAAASARQHGAHVPGIFEQAGFGARNRFVRGLWRWPEKLSQATLLRLRLAGVPYRWSSIVMAAHGADHLQYIELDSPQGCRRMDCDLLAVGYGLIPNVELARLLGCRLEQQGAHPCVSVDAWQRTSMSNVYAIGEACGIGGCDSALAEGAIAGRTAAGATAIPAKLKRRRRHARYFASRLREHFTLDPRIRTLAQPDTLVCRCEDIPLRALDHQHDARSAKLATRCGMGPCQGRICGTALAEMGYFPFTDGQRPPLFPARLGTLAETDTASH